MRAFIGIDFDEEMKNEISGLQDRLRNYAVKGRWKYVDNFHITLKFLDEINDTQREKMGEILKEACKNKEPFRLYVSKLGIFKGRDSIRVLWLGLDGELEKLKAIHSEAEEAALKVGFEKEKRDFKPHVTIGQDLIFKNPFDSINETMDLSGFPKIEVKELFLFKSEQIGKKRVYTKTEMYKLGC